MMRVIFSTDQGATELGATSRFLDIVFLKFLFLMKAVQASLRKKINGDDGCYLDWSEPQ